MVMVRGSFGGPVRRLNSKARDRLDKGDGWAQRTDVVRTRAGSEAVVTIETRRKNDRLELRLEPERRRVLDEAAAASGMSTSAFVLTHATTAARQVLADRTAFVLPKGHWDAFVRVLERDGQPMDDLAAFLARPSVLAEE